MRKISHSFASLSFLGFFSLAAYGETNIQVSENSQLQFLDNRTTLELKANVLTRVDLNSPAILSVPAKIPTLVIPVCSGNSTVKLNPPALAAAMNKSMEQEMGNRLSKILTEIADIQSLIRAKQLDHALTQLDALQVNFPDLKFLGFLRASILFLQGKKSEARKLTEETLKIFPDYKEGQKFLADLKGGG